MTAEILRFTPARDDARPSGEIATIAPVDHGAFYYRKALRIAADGYRLTGVLRIGMTVCAELEELRAWVIEQGLEPPRFYATAEEAKAKGWEVEDAFRSV